MKAAYFLVLVAALVVPQANAQNVPTLPGSNHSMTGLGFGGTVTVGDGVIFAGSAPLGWPRGDEPAGEVYQYNLDDSGRWTTTAVFRAPDGGIGDDFGRTVATKGDLMVIGAPGLATAYVYRQAQDGSWQPAGELKPSVIDGAAEFGGAYARGGARVQNIAIGSGFVAVTAYDGGTSTGAVHVFAEKGGAWSEVTRVHPDAAAAGDGFGFSVAAHDNALLVGAPESNDDLGAVYAFTVDTAAGSVALDARIQPDGIEGAAAFGASLGMHLKHALVGAPRANRTGMLLAFDGFNGWTEMARQAAPDIEGVRIFGYGSSFAVSMTDVLVGTRSGVVLASPFALEPDYTVISAPDERRQPGFGNGLAIHGNVAVIGSPTADFEAGIASVYEKSAVSSRWFDAGVLESDVTEMPAITGDEIRCEDGKAAAYACEGVDLVAFMPISGLASNRGVGMTDVWGWTDEVTGKEWVLAGRTEGVSFVDISDPGHPVYVGELPKTATSPGSGWRDVKVYRDHAYVVADGAGQHGIQIFDMRQLRDVRPEDMPVTFAETNRYDGVASTHNIVINEETGFGFAVGNRSGGETCNGQLHMIDLSDPANPTFAGCFSQPDAGGTHDSQCVVYRGPDADYQGREICLNSNGGSFVIADVTDKQNPVTIVSTDYPLLAYTHQGWLTEDHRYFYMNDELDEMNNLVSGTRTLIWDVQDLDDPILAGEYTSDVMASDHNLYIQGNTMYQSNYQAGMRVLDITDPLNPVEIGFFDTVPFGEDEAGFGGSWSNYPYFKSGVIPITSRGEGLFLVRKQVQDL